MHLKFEEMAQNNPSKEVQQALGKFFYKAYKDAEKEEKDKLRDVVLKHLVLPEFDKFLKPNFRNIR